MLSHLLHLSRTNTLATTRELAVLGVLIEQPEIEPMARTLSTYLKVPKPVITRVSDYLAAQGLAVRRRVPGDGRLVHLEVTKKGQKFWAGLMMAGGAEAKSANVVKFARPASSKNGPATTGLNGKRKKEVPL